VGIQIRVGDNNFVDYYIGDFVEIPDGIYFGYGGAVVIFNGTVVAVFSEKDYYNKWGGTPEIKLES
jgi:hypothetical protein